jgi:D-methionine transport system substrate-binding protein
MKIRNIIIGALTLTSLFGCGKNENTITVGATAAPHAEILEQVKPILEAKGYELEIKVYTDYITPNTALEDGDLDANYFQHITYLNDFNLEHGTHLASAGNVHYEPFGLYAGSKNSLSAVSNGDKILVPNDATNEARALLLLEQVGLITLKEDAGIKATKYDIVSNPNNLEIIEMNAELIAGVKEDAAYAVINGNYAIDAGLKVSDALAVEANDGTAASAYANVLAVSENNLNNEKIIALYEALTSESIKKYINDTYLGSVVALF